MRIKSIEIWNYRGLYGNCLLDLTNSCKNLMLYGENGSGKSSLCHALETFVRSSLYDTQIESQKNVFAIEPANPLIKVVFKETNCNLKEVLLDNTKRNIEESFLRETYKIKGVLSYKNLFYVHHLTNTPSATTSVNVFGLLIKSLLYDMPISLHGYPIGKTWDSLISDRNRRKNSRVFKGVPDRLNSFNKSIARLLKEIQDKANDIVQMFGYNIEIALEYKGVAVDPYNKHINNQEIILSIKFNDKHIPYYHTFLNEARLTALAIAIYFSSILIMPQGTSFKVLILDDILIGLDMSNRMPLLAILEKYFGDYQIFMTTHDRNWYESTKSSLDHNRWQFAEMYVQADHQQGFDIPIIRCGEHVDYIFTSKAYFDKGDLRASAVYIRTAFEQILSRYCHMRRLPVRFSIDPSKVSSEDLWQAIKNCGILDNSLVKEVESYRSLVMNPFSHYDIKNPQFHVELRATITAVEQLKTKLAGRYGP